jgi:DNA topoisomerase I
MPRVRRVDCSEPGIVRVRRGRGFSYRDAAGDPVSDPAVLERIRGLGIPPAWRDVWICMEPYGHIQATGYDEAGRKQYLYHDAWREAKDRAKFGRMEDFARSLPAMRTALDARLGGRGLGRDRVLACAVKLLDLGFFRIGGETYAVENESYGLATMRRDHVKLAGGVAVFDYPAKSGQRRVQTIAEPTVFPVLRALKARPAHAGVELLGYWAGREWRDVRSHDINEELKELTGAEYSAKDFRTWHATVLAAVALANADADTSTQTARKRAAKAAVERVASYLGNTPTVCRQAYIDPRVFDRFDSGQTVLPALERLARSADPGEFPERERIERAVLRLLRG